ncbi:MAG: hypothetical protein WBV69_05125 [Candidatus Sulfotelmatobacter sp.]
MSVHKVEMKEGEEPYKWKVTKVADIGGDEEFTKGMLELASVLEAGMIEGHQRDEVKHAIVCTLIDGLMPAFLKLEEIRASTGKAMPLMNIEQLYEDFARKLWKAYKELMQVTLDLMGHNIGFLFRGDKEFREGLAVLRRENPNLRVGFEKFLQETRDEWQNDLSKFRNTWVEHQRGDRKQFHKFYDAKNAEWLFDTVWRTIADILPAFLELHLPHGTRLIEQHPNDPRPRWGQRFRYDVPHFRNLK